MAERVGFEPTGRDNNESTGDLAGRSFKPTQASLHKMVPLEGFEPSTSMSLALPLLPIGVQRHI